MDEKPRKTPKEIHEEVERRERKRQAAEAGLLATTLALIAAGLGFCLKVGAELAEALFGDHHH